jgi:hypothetical protein
MFQPLQAILKWNTSFIYFESAIDTTTDLLFYICSLIGVSLLLSVYNNGNWDELNWNIN